MRLLLAFAFVACFFLAFSFKFTGGRSFSKIEVGLAGKPWLVRVDREGDVHTSFDPAAGSAFCGYALPILFVARSLLRRSK